MFFHFKLIILVSHLRIYLVSNKAKCNVLFLFLLNFCFVKKVYFLYCPTTLFFTAFQIVKLFLKLNQTTEKQYLQLFDLIYCMKDDFPDLFAGHQREIFPGGTKVDAGPPNFFGHQSSAKFFILIFCPKLS